MPEELDISKLITRGLHTFAPICGPTGCQSIVVAARIKLPLKQGHWSAFWMLPEDASLGWPKAGEIDIMEHVNLEPAVVGTVHLANADGAHMQAPTPPNNSIPMALESIQGFNTYQIVWRQDEIQYFVNDRHVYSVLKSDLPSWPFAKPFYLVLNLAIGGNWPGFNVDTAGGEMLVDWVSVWRAPG